MALDASARTVTLRDTDTGAEQTEAYDKLILAVGAEPFVPDVPGTGLPGVFKMRTPDDAIAARAWAEQNGCRRAVVVGGDFIGLEVAENLLAKCLSVTVVDMASQLMPNIFDPEMAGYVKRQLQAKGVRVLTGTALQGINGTDRAAGVTTDGGTLPADLVVLAIGIRPATAFLQGTGLEMVKGAILVDDKQATNLPDVYAVGDCAMVYNALTGKPQWSAMGSTANLTGRCLARNLSGEPSPYGGCLGTGVVKLLDNLCAGRTGLTETQAKDAGFDPVSVVCVTEEFTDGYKIYLGGRWGKRIAHGHPMDKIFTSEEEVLDIVERAILFFRDEGITGERFADTIDRLGFDYVQNKLLTAPVDKETVLQKKVKGGATC